MIKLNKLAPEVLKELHARLQDEFNAFYFYRSATNWCKNAGFETASEYFARESADELVHANKLEDYMVDWNSTPELPLIKRPVLIFSTLGDIIEKAYAIEYLLYCEYENSSMKIMDSGNLGVFDFLKEFLTIQTNSVAEYATLINKLEGVNVGDKSTMLLLEETLFGS